MNLLNTTALEVEQLPDGLRLSAVVRTFFEWFFTPAEVELYAPWIDLITLFGTLFLAACFLRFLFAPLFPSRRAKK